MKYKNNKTNQFTENFGVISEKDFELLSNVKILIIGLGGLGSNLANLLVRLGVHNLKLVDFDVFEISNLNRQMFSNLENIGHAKVDVMKKELIKINVNCNIESIVSRIEDVTFDDLNEFDYIIDTVDNSITKKYISKLGTNLNTPVLHGACAGWYGQVGWMMPGSNLISEIYIDNIPGIEKELRNPSFTPSAIASVMVSEFLKMIKQSSETIINELLLIDLYNNSMLKTGQKETD